MPTTQNDLPANDFLVYRINNNYHYFDVSIINLDGRSHTIKPSAIKELVMEDKFQNFYQIGYIVIDNSFDMIERDYTGSNSSTSPAYYSQSSDFNNVGNFANINNTGQLSVDTTSSNQFNTGNFRNINNTGISTSSPAGQIPMTGFVFKGDARDILRVDIMPSLDTDNPGALGDEDQQKLFRMYFDFAIYHAEDIEGDSPDQKLKKLYFWDLYYEIMRTQNTYFSTAKYVSNNNSSQTNKSTTNNADLQNRTDSGRAIKTGKAIRELINETFNKNETGPGRYPAHFYPSPSSSNSSSDENDPNWDMGSTTVFFSAPARYKVLDALYYLLDRHVSTADSNYDQSFLRLERFPRVFTLTNLKSVFDNAYIQSNDVSGNEYLETVKIAGYTTVQDDGENTKWGYELQLVPQKALYLDKYGTFRTFNYSDMSGIFTQRELTSKIIHSYDHENKIFEIDQVDNDFEETKNVFFNNYGKQLKGATTPFFNSGEMRQKRFNVQTDFSSIQQDKIQRLAFGRNRSLYAGIFASNMVCFKLPGSTHRQAGKFIGIDRDGAMEGSAFDNKILGIYFILEVRHIFQNGEYINELKCVKTYHANPINSDVSI